MIWVRIPLDMEFPLQYMVYHSRETEAEGKVGYP